MKSFISTAASALSLLVATMGAAHADLNLPEPGSLALTGLGLAAAVFFLRKGKKK